jgi:hypothetical protein
MSYPTTRDGFIASGEGRTNGGPPLNEPEAKKQKSVSRGQANIANVMAFNNRSLSIGRIHGVCMKSTFSGLCSSRSLFCPLHQ